jgi:hypothetical protein
MQVRQLLLRQTFRCKKLYDFHEHPTLLPHLKTPSIAIDSVVLRFAEVGREHGIREPWKVTGIYFMVVPISKQEQRQGSKQE